MTPTCPNCGKSAQLWQASRVYGPGWDDTPLWGCDCTRGLHYVGCHPGTTEPLGTLADKGLRQLRRIVHDRLDPIWQNGWWGRNATYIWLAQAIGVPIEECHVGMFDRPRCFAAIDALKSHPYHVARTAQHPARRGTQKGR